MGLDITVYRGLKKAVGDEGKHPEYDDDADWQNDWFTIYGNGDYFPGRMEGVEPGRYQAEEEFGFCAGSYSGYNYWREQLAALVGYGAEPHPSEHRKGEQSHAAGAWSVESGPFWELINFSDCEGTIGPVVAAKLAKDFAEWQDRADKHGDDYWREKYAEWRKAFEMAATGGAVCFH